jgi:hypothetical protein
MDTTYKVDVRRYFVETGRVNSKGKPVRIPVTIRKLFLFGKFLFPQTSHYRVVRTVRRGLVSYSVSYTPVIESPWWEKKAPVESSEDFIRLDRTKGDGKFTDTEFVTWLTAKVGTRALAIKLELDTAVPSSMEEAA